VLAGGGLPEGRIACVTFCTFLALVNIRSTPLRVAVDMGDAQVPEETPTILVVEDEVLVRSATSNYLRACGFNVLEAANAEEALETILADRQVRLVFADIRLPGAHSGLDLVRIIRGSHPNLKLLLTTGMAPFPEEQGVTLLRKPYFLFEVERQVRSLLQFHPVQAAR